MNETQARAKHVRGLGSPFQRGEIWWIRYWVRGTEYRESLGREDNGRPRSHAAAVKLLKQRIRDAGNGKPVGPDVDKITLEELLQILTDEYKANGRRERVIRSPIAHLKKYFGKDCAAIDITTDRITTYVTKRQDAGAAAATINRSLAALKRAFKLALQAGRVSIRPHVPMLREDNRRKGFFEHADCRALVEHLPAYLRPVIETAYCTGWRITSELLTRQKHHVDLDAGWLRLDPGESKNGEGRMFPLTPELRAVLERQLDATKALELETERIIPWLFHHNGKPIRIFRKAWATACDKAKLPGRIPHDFRRSAVRNLERAGVPRSAAMAMVGHKTEAIYRRYAIADESMLKAGAEKLAALHRADVNGKKPGAVVVPFAKAK